MQAVCHHTCFAWSTLRQVPLTLTSVSYDLTTPKTHSFCGITTKTGKTLPHLLTPYHDLKTYSSIFFYIYSTSQTAFLLEIEYSVLQTFSPHKASIKPAPLNKLKNVMSLGNISLALLTLTAPISTTALIKVIK